MHLRLKNKTQRKSKTGEEYFELSFEYPDGSKRVQGGYHWSQSCMGGVIWKDLPLVQVGNDGQEIR